MEDLWVLADRRILYLEYEVLPGRSRGGGRRFVRP